VTGKPRGVLETGEEKTCHKCPTGRCKRRYVELKHQECRLSPNKHLTRSWMTKSIQGNSSWRVICCSAQSYLRPRCWSYATENVDPEFWENREEFHAVDYCKETRCWFPRMITSARRRPIFGLSPWPWANARRCSNQIQWRKRSASHPALLQ
jgi:hypothetical protein